MKWDILINKILDLKNQYPNELENLFIEKDEQYPTKYKIFYDISNKIEDIKENWIYNKTIFIDINDEYSYKDRIVLYFKIKENWEFSDFFYNNIIKWKNIDCNEEDFIISLIEMLII